MSSSKTSWTLNSYDAHREPCKIELTSWCGWWAHKAPLSYKEIMTFNIGRAWGAGLRTLTLWNIYKCLPLAGREDILLTVVQPLVSFPWFCESDPSTMFLQVIISNFIESSNSTWVEIFLSYIFFYCWCPLWSDQISAYLSMRIPSNCGLKREGQVHITVQGQ